MTDLFISQEIIDFNYPSQKKSVSNVIMEAPVDILLIPSIG